MKKEKIQNHHTYSSTLISLSLRLDKMSLMEKNLFFFLNSALVCVFMAGTKNIALTRSFHPFKIFSCKFRKERLHFPWDSERLNWNRKLKGNTECFLRIKMCLFLICKVIHKCFLRKSIHTAFLNRLGIPLPQALTDLFEKVLWKKKRQSQWWN